MERLEVAREMVNQPLTLCRRDQGTTPDGGFPRLLVREILIIVLHYRFVEILDTQKQVSNVEHTI
jgi:hypothetical protein